MAEWDWAKHVAYIAYVTSARSCMKAIKGPNAVIELVSNSSEQEIFQDVQSSVLLNLSEK